MNLFYLFIGFHFFATCRIIYCLYKNAKNRRTDSRTWYFQLAGFAMSIPSFLLTLVLKDQALQAQAIYPPVLVYISYVWNSIQIGCIMYGINLSYVRIKHGLNGVK